MCVSLKKPWIYVFLVHCETVKTDLLLIVKSAVNLQISIATPYVSNTIEKKKRNREYFITIKKKEM